MARFRQMKHTLEALLLPPTWPEEAEALPQPVAALGAMVQVAPLLALLPRGGLLMWRAAIALGIVAAKLAQTAEDDARTIVRHCMWRLNEDSGNMGWGAAEALGEIAARSPLLAGEYGRVILSYLRNTGAADNRIDHGPLRRGAYWAVGRFAPLYPAYKAEAWELLLLGLDDDDAPCRGIAAWGLGKLARAGACPSVQDNALVAARLRNMEREIEESCQGQVTILEGLRLRTGTPAEFARQAIVEASAGC